ncbi:hypothetical protein [Nocardia salmonicida]|uniref:hypothetical protein n=1 Tax=Nocardia salmonicida TaxID=53431 RepID=UPI0033D712C8
MSEATGETRTYANVHDLVDHAELVDIRFYEVAASRTDSDESRHSIQVVSRVELAEIEIRCRAAVDGGGAQYKVDAGAVFTLAPPGAVVPEIVREFTEKVGVMAVYPYVRSAVSNLGAQLGVDRPTLPLLRFGSIRLDEQGTSSESPV